jgi:hypothetical protein
MGSFTWSERERGATISLIVLVAGQQHVHKPGVWERPIPCHATSPTSLSRLRPSVRISRKRLMRPFAALCSVRRHRRRAGVSISGRCLDKMPQIIPATDCEWFSFNQQPMAFAVGRIYAGEPPCLLSSIMRSPPGSNRGKPALPRAHSSGAPVRATFENRSLRWGMECRNPSPTNNWATRDCFRYGGTG